MGGLDRQDHQGLLRSSSAIHRQLQLQGENVTEFAITANTVETYLRLFENQPMFTQIIVTLTSTNPDFPLPCVTIVCPKNSSYIRVIMRRHSCDISTGLTTLSIATNSNKPFCIKNHCILHCIIVYTVHLPLQSG